MKSNDTRLSVRAYFEALEGVEAQFDLIRYALKNLSKSAIKRFFKARLRHHLDTIGKVFESMRASAKGDEIEGWNQNEEMLKAFVKKRHKKDSRPSDSHFKIEFSEDRLNQSELLLLVAHFESFMKEVHRTFLKAAPHNVFSKRDTKVLLREVFPEGGQFNKFVNELIIKEVKFLDSQRVERRAEYFAEHFGVSFGSQKEIDELAEIMDTRNKISHEIYFALPRSLEQIKEQSLVSDQMLKRARGHFRAIPRRCVEVGAKTFQSYFR